MLFGHSQSPMTSKFQYQEQTTHFRSSIAKLRILRSCSEIEIQTVGRQRSTSDTTQTQINPKDLYFFTNLSKIHSKKIVFKRNLRVDNTCPSPADVNKNTLLSRPAARSEMPLCQQESWAGPKNS